MVKIKKGYNLRVISLLLAGLFLLNSTVYGTDLYSKTHLRTSLMGNNKEYGKRLKEVLLVNIYGQESKIWTSEQIAKIPEAIKALYDAGIEVNNGAIQYDITPETSKLLKEVINREGITGCALHARAIGVYKGWDSVLKAAGLDHSEIKKEQGPIRCYYQGTGFPSKLERDTAIILLYFGIIEEISKGVSWQVKIGSSFFDFYSEKSDVYFEPHQDVRNQSSIEDYLAERRKILDQEGYAESGCYAFETTHVLVHEILPQLGIIIKQSDIVFINNEIALDGTSDKENSYTEGFGTPYRNLENIQVNI